MKEKIITVVGSLNYDIIFKQKRLPKIGETLIADSVHFEGGGKGANQAVQCSKLGACTYLVGAVGNDAFGDYLIKRIKSFNVNTDYIKVVEGVSTGIGVVNSFEDGTLIATISQGANHSINKDMIEEADELLKKSNIVILQMEIPIEIVEYVINKASDYGCYIILNAAPARNISIECLSKVNCLIVNENEASFYLKKNISDVESAKKYGKNLFEKIKDTLIITLGEKGSVLFNKFNKENGIYIEAVNVNAVDTTGAGDSYVGAFAFKILEGCDVENSARFATKAAAFTVKKIGAQGAMPYLDEISW